MNETRVASGKKLHAVLGSWRVDVGVFEYLRSRVDGSVEDEYSWTSTAGVLADLLAERGYPIFAEMILKHHQRSE